LRWSDNNSWTFLVVGDCVTDTLLRWNTRQTTLTVIVNLGFGFTSDTAIATVGDRAFPVVAARIWNNLPAEVTSLTSLPTFKSKLKSHLFSA